jgi:hypothetical protein
MIVLYRGLFLAVLKHYILHRHHVHQWHVKHRHNAGIVIPIHEVLVLIKVVSVLGKSFVKRALIWEKVCFSCDL